MGLTLTRIQIQGRVRESKPQVILKLTRVFVCGYVFERRADVAGDGVFEGAREATLHFSAS